MALSRKLLNVLDNDEEPLRKRLKIADNAFKSEDLPVHRREVFLLKWLSHYTKDSNTEVWDLLYNWLQSEQMRSLNRTDLTQKDVTILFEVIKSKFNDFTSLKSDVKKLIINSAVAIIENKTFQIYFKYDLREYCELVSNVISNINEKEIVLGILRNANLFHKLYISTEKFYKHFLDICLPILSDIVCKFNSDDIYQEILKIIQKCIFLKNYKQFDGYLKQFYEETDVIEKYHIPKYVIKNLRFHYNTDVNKSKYIFKLLLNAYCNSYSNNFLMIFKFVILLHEILGYNTSKAFKLNKIEKIHNCESNFRKSLEIQAHLVEVLTKSKNVMDCKINEISFSAFLQNIILSIIRLTKRPDINAINIISHMIIINPLIIESIINEILVYLMLSNNKEISCEYQKILIKIFEVFAKLYRIQNLISKMIPALKNSLDGNSKSLKKTYKFDGSVENKKELCYEYEIQNMLPESVLTYFGQCITTLASWQVMNLFKTLLFHLESAVTTHLRNITEDPKQMIYVQVIGTLTCLLLSSVRIAEHTVPDLAVNKFIKCMEELKVILGKFGARLVSMEHNHVLMGMYLNLCYTWGELYIVICYYSTNNEIPLDKSLDNDYSACNIAYIHSYLTVEQWCLISQRIKNFGEKPCKQIMQKLFTQRIKSMLLFENDLNEDLINSFIKNLVLFLEDCWEDVLQDPFIVTTVIPKMQNEHIMTLAEIIVKHIVHNDVNILLKTKILECQILTNAVIFILISKINKLIKHKHKQNEMVLLSSNTYNLLNEKSFFNSGSDNSEILDQMGQLFKEVRNDENMSEESYLKFSEDKLHIYLNIFKLLPVTSLQTEVQIALFLYLALLLRDLNIYNYSSSSGLQETLQNILTGLLQNTPPDITTYMKPAVLIEYLMKNFSTNSEAFKYVIENILKSDENFKNLKTLVNYLVKHLKCDKSLKCTLLLLNITSQNMKLKKKIILENKVELLEYKEKIYSSLFKLISEENCSSDLIEPYALVLRDNLSGSTDNLSTFLPYLDTYIDLAISNVSHALEGDIKGSLILFSTILQHKAKFNNIDDEFILKVWNASKTIEIADEDMESYSRVLVLLFEQVSNKKFSDIINDLLSVTVNILKSNKYLAFSKQIKIWDCILSCNFNPIKEKLCQQALQTLLQKILTATLNSSDEENFHENVAKFEIHLIKSVHHIISPVTLDTIFLSVSTLLSESSNFVVTFSYCIHILESLLKYRKDLVTDRLPSFLQQYRILLQHLCQKSDSNLKLDVTKVQQFSDCGLHLEKLTKLLVALNKHMIRITPYLIADILHQYESITLYPNVKMHINNCIFSLMSLCDQHAVSFLMRVLSTASTEIFKFMYENYKKYYSFTGKV